MHWFALRARRSSMPLSGRLARNRERRLAFAAAMQQFEEQMTAAKIVTAATRPLNLYYALVQAGLAITAVHADRHWRWKSHGLTLTNMTSALEDITVAPSGVGAFQFVAGATGSNQVAGPVRIGALWASLPDICNVAALPHSGKPRALSVFDETGTASSGFTIFDTGYTKTGPTFMSPQGPCASLLLNQALPEPAERQSWLQEMMTHYPTAQLWAQPTGRNTFEEVSDRQCHVHLVWPDSARQQGLTNADLDAFFDGVAPQYLYRRQRYLRPSLEGNGSIPPTPLMTWWLLAFSFSMLARYAPEQWVAMLDLDESPYAVSLQYACEAALTVIPHLVREALDGEPVLLIQQGFHW